MMKSTRRRLLAAALIFGMAAPAMAQRSVPPRPFAQPAPPPFLWWKSEDSKKELHLTADQSARIDTIWQTTRPELRLEWNELNRLEEKLSRMLQKDADEAVLARQIDRVETARANANKTRSLMLVQMMKVLTMEQRDGLTALHERYLHNLQPPKAPAQPRSSEGRSKK
jgi:Spy/CpxP family protein refolding chaperone